MQPHTRAKDSEHILFYQQVPGTEIDRHTEFCAASYRFNRGNQYKADISLNVRIFAKVKCMPRAAFARANNDVVNGLKVNQAIVFIKQANFNFQVLFSKKPPFCVNGIRIEYDVYVLNGFIVKDRNFQFEKQCAIAHPDAVRLLPASIKLVTKYGKRGIS